MTYLFFFFFWKTGLDEKKARVTESGSMMGIQASTLRIILNGREEVPYNLTSKVFNFESLTVNSGFYRRRWKY